jgi:UTP--glucose-1-phosphate uridylyltransferase
MVVMTPTRNRASRSFHSLLSSFMNCTQAILPVAGLGTRFLPWTKAVPKEMLPIGNQPMIALLVDECLSVGIRDICFVISPGKEAIARYFRPHPELEWELERRGKRSMLRDLMRYDDVHFHFTYQHDQLGDGHAVLQAANWVEDDAVAILFGDDLILGERNGLQQMLAAYERLSHGEAASLVCLEDIDRLRVSQYGIVEADNDWNGSDERTLKIKNLVEKPNPQDAPSTLGIVGRYIIPSSLLDVLGGMQTGSKDGEIRLIDAFIESKDRMNHYGYVLEGTRVDTGTPEGYADALRRMIEMPLTLAMA